MNFDRVIRLTSGAGNGVDQACLMTASNMLIGKGSMGDVATCQCDLIRAFVIPTNDAMPDDLRCELYGPLVYEILGTKTDDPQLLQQRAFAFADWAVREIAPIALRANGLAEDAKKLEGLPTICDDATAAAVADAAARAAADAVAAAVAAASAATHAAHAARAAAASAAAHAARAAANTIWRKCPEIILRVAAIGDRRPVEPACTVDELADALSK